MHGYRIRVEGDSSGGKHGPARHLGNVRSRPAPTLRAGWMRASLAAILTGMSDVTCILSAIEQGDPHAASQLLPLVYDELRQLAAQKLAQEKPGQTLQATAL